MKLQATVPLIFEQSTPGAAAVDLPQLDVPEAPLPGLDCARLGISAANQLLVAVTEKRSKDQIDTLAALLREAR